jgi:hypothetical protein
MDPKEAWDQALSQFQMEMNRSTFETWVRDARFLKFENGVFYIGLANGYARDWLEDRLTGLARKVLTGIWGSSAEVKFEVSSSFKENAEGPTLEEPAARSYDGSKNFETLYASITDDILKPDTIQTIPQYLWRLAPFLGPTSTCRYLGIRQIQYFRGLMDRDGVFRATLRELADFSGMSPQSWLQGSRSALETWLFRCDSSGVDSVRGDRGRFLQSKAKKYFACGTLPLSPADQQALWSHLLRFGVERDPISALREALRQMEENSRYYLLSSTVPLPVRVPLPPSLTVEQMVTASCQLDKKNADLVRGLAHELQRRLVGGWDSVPQYFVRRVGPEINYGPMLLVLWLQHRISHKSRREIELHPESDRILIRGGFREIGCQLGMNSRTVASWFNKKYKIDLLERYAILQESKKLSDQSVSLLFQVKISDRDCPLLPADETIANRRFLESVLEK